MRYRVCVCLHLGFRAKPTELQPCWQFAFEIRHQATQPGQTTVWVSGFSGHQPVLGTSVPQLCCNFPHGELHPAFPCHDRGVGGQGSSVLHSATACTNAAAGLVVLEPLCPADLGQDLSFHLPARHSWVLASSLWAGPFPFRCVAHLCPRAWAQVTTSHQCRVALGFS